MGNRPCRVLRVSQSQYAAHKALDFRSVILSVQKQPGITLSHVPVITAFSGSFL
jgi:hypothetical protein